MTETLASGTVNADEGARALRESSRLAEAGIVAQATLEGISDGTGRVRLAPRAGYGRDNGRVGVLDLLACAGLRLPEGVVLTRRAHASTIAGLRRREGCRVDGAVPDAHLVTATFQLRRIVPEALPLHFLAR
jgi:hypothetical protein